MFARSSSVSAVALHSEARALILCSASSSLSLVCASLTASHHASYSSAMVS